MAEEKANLTWQEEKTILTRGGGEDNSNMDRGEDHSNIVVGEDQSNMARGEDHSNIV